MVPRLFPLFLPPLSFSTCCAFGLGGIVLFSSVFPCYLGVLPFVPSVATSLGRRAQPGPLALLSPGRGLGHAQAPVSLLIPPPPNSFVFTVSRGFAPERAAPPRTQGCLPGSLPFFLKFVCWKTASEGLPIMVFVSDNKPSVCVRLKTALSCSCLKGSLAQSRLSCSLSIDF